MSDSLPDPQTVLAALGEFTDPETGRSVTEMEQVHDIRVSDGEISLTLALTTHSAPLWEETREAAAALLRERFPAATKVTVNQAIHERLPEKIGEIGLTAKSVIAVGSGKGGVGKSTVAASIAYGLRRAGCAVGLMDADVYGPSIPHLLGVNERPAVEDQKIVPINAGGVNVMSMGFMVPPGEAVVWRGPMLHGAITQFLRDTRWGNLDYLVIDMPPGTGDIALTLSQLLPLTGAVVVCTPQDVALLDAGKAIAMFQKVNIPVLGMVENMSYFICPNCDARHEIFGTGGAKRRAEQLDIPFLGELPINVQIRVLGDQGRTGQSYDDGSIGPWFESICHNLVKELASRHRQDPPLPSLSVL